MVGGSANGAQSSEEPEGRPKGNEALLWPDRDEGLEQVIRQGATGQATQEKQVEKAGGKRLIFAKITKIDKTGQTDC